MASVTGVRPAVSTHPVRRPGAGCPARPVSGHLVSSSGIRRSGRLVSTRPASSPLLSTRPASTRPVSSPLLSAPVGPVASGRVRLLPPPAVAVGTRSRRQATLTTATGSRILWRPHRRAAGSPAEEPWGTGGAAELARWSAEVSAADPGQGWVRVAAAAHARCAARQARPACGVFVAGGYAVGRGAGPGASWPQRPGRCRPRVGWRPRWVVVVAPACQGGHPAGMGCGPSAAQAGSRCSRLAAGSVMTCGNEWWACQDLNLGPHPYQLNAGNRCADRPFPRSRPTVGAQGMRSIRPLVCVHLSWR